MSEDLKKFIRDITIDPYDFPTQHRRFGNKTAGDYYVEAPIGMVSQVTRRATSRTFNIRNTEWQSRTSWRAGPHPECKDEARRARKLRESLSR